MLLVYSLEFCIQNMCVFLLILIKSLEFLKQYSIVIGTKKNVYTHIVYKNIFYKIKVKCACVKLILFIIQIHTMYSVSKLIR